MLKALIVAVALGAAAVAAHAGAYDSGLAQSAKDRHAPGNQFSGFYDFGPSKSANDRHAPGNYIPRP